jgi:hypothetical protein
MPEYIAGLITTKFKKVFWKSIRPFVNLLMVGNPAFQADNLATIAPRCIVTLLAVLVNVLLIKLLCLTCSSRRMQT